MNIIIIVILILIIVYLLHYKKENLENNLTETAISNFIDNISKCYDTTQEMNFKNVHTSELYIDNKELSTYFLDLCFPIGSYYVQYPDISSNSMDLAFPASQNPKNLFKGGIWKEVWADEAIFFRTEGKFADEKRVNGVQDYAIYRITGTTPLSQYDYNWISKDNKGGATGVFKGELSSFNIQSDEDYDTDAVTRSYFDSSAQVKTGNELRVRNRLIRIWKRIG
jgi:hypothetical protein